MKKLTIDKEFEKIRKAIKEIGVSKAPLNKELVNEIRRVLVEKGYDEQWCIQSRAHLATDMNAEIVRILAICRRYELSPEAAAKILDDLRRIESGEL